MFYNNNKFFLLTVLVLSIGMMQGAKASSNEDDSFVDEPTGTNFENNKDGDESNNSNQSTPSITSKQEINIINISGTDSNNTILNKLNITEEENNQITEPEIIKNFSNDLDDIEIHSEIDQHESNIEQNDDQDFQDALNYFDQNDHYFFYIGDIINNFSRRFIATNKFLALYNANPNKMANIDRSVAFNIMIRDLKNINNELANGDKMNLEGNKMNLEKVINSLVENDDFSQNNYKLALIAYVEAMTQISFSDNNPRNQDISGLKGEIGNISNTINTMKGKIDNVDTTVGNLKTDTLKKLDNIINNKTNNDNELPAWKKYQILGGFVGCIGVGAIWGISSYVFSGKAAQKKAFDTLPVDDADQGERLI